MEEKNQLTVSYLAYESSMARLERIIKRLWILCIICFVALIGTNAAWLYYESQFKKFEITQDVDSGFAPAVISGTGDVTYGTGKTDYQVSP